jgi:hypothetical protein
LEELEAAMKFITGFCKSAAASAGFWHDPKALDKAGLGLLAAAPAAHLYNSATGRKSGSKEEAALGAGELGGLGMLYRSVQKAKH